MKRILALLLALTLLFALAACKDEKDTVSDVKTSTEQIESEVADTSSTESTEFTEPENYTTVLQVKSGIELNIYTDKDGKVLAVEPLNDDAKIVANDLNLSQENYEKVVSDIITKATEKGFVKSNTAVNLSVTENKSENINTDDILSKANTATTNAATKLGIKLKVESSSSVKKPTESKPDTSSKEETSEPAESSKPQETSKVEENEKPAESSAPEHTHSYSAATCTEPKKCSCGSTDGSALGHSYSDATCTEAKKCSRCGATDGNALGHKWQEATCKAPKTCSVCKATEGDIGDHKYSDGKCKYCDKQQIINPKTGLKEHGDYYHVRDDGNGFKRLIIWQFYDSLFGPKDPCGVYNSNKECWDEEETIVYKGTTYYSMGHGGPLPQYTLTDQEIILKYTDEQLIDFPDYADCEDRLIVNHEYDLEVIYSNDGMFKKGEILDLVE